VTRIVEVTTEADVPVPRVRVTVFEVTTGWAEVAVALAGSVDGAGEAFVVGDRVVPVRPPVEALSMIEDETLPTSLMGQTIVVRTTVSVTVAVVF